MSSKPSILKHPYFDYWFYGSLAYLAYFLFATYREFFSEVDLKTPFIYALTVQEYFGNWTTYVLPIFSAAMVLPFVYIRKSKRKDGSSVQFIVFVLWVLTSCPFLISLASLFLGPTTREELVSVVDHNFGLGVTYVRSQSPNRMIEDRIDIYLMKSKNMSSRVLIYSGTDPDMYQSRYTAKFIGDLIQVSDPMCSEMHSKHVDVQVEATSYRIKYVENRVSQETD